MNDPLRTDRHVARRIELHGHVQGIGYRPALARLASGLGLKGVVRNTSCGVEVHVEGALERVQFFIEKIDSACPESGNLQEKVVHEASVQCCDKFSIANAAKLNLLSTTVPADSVVCRACLDEVADPTNRRYGYLLNGCCSCGPRYTLLNSMPFERAGTSMNRFEMCSACCEDYSDPTNRRFHAQTICCANCGPSLQNLADALAALQGGEIVGVKGVGGYQLLVDARNADAVQRLRTKKARYDKPFAVMFPTVQNAELYGNIQPHDRALLQSAAGPIVVVAARQGCLPKQVSMELNSIGAMLPTTPLHAWLVNEIGPLVVTSANREGEPIAFRSTEQLETVGAIADVFVDHNRDIVRPVDDSVVRVMGMQTVTLRHARGFAPRTLHLGTSLDDEKHHIMAVGAEQKVAIALTNGSQAILGPHLGDMDTLAARERFVEQVDDLTQLYGADPAIIVHDCHEDYFTTRWAKEYAAKRQLRTIAVQHHHAHIVAGMIDAGWLEREVLGVAWDGTGAGTDDTIWGGEFLRATSSGFERVACLRPFLMPGGEAAIREPWRLAVSLIHDLQAWEPMVDFELPEASSLEKMMIRSINSPVTSSVGRLFDAVAALILPAESQNKSASCSEVPSSETMNSETVNSQLSTSATVRVDSLLRRRTGYEGHFAVLLETCCDLDAKGRYPMPICEPGMLTLANGKPLRLPQTLDWRPMLLAILEDLKRNTPASTMAMRFHRTMANAVFRLTDVYEELPVVLGGGVFQNKVLVDLIAAEFSERAIPLAIPTALPINDGGIAAGQLAIASAMLAEGQRCA